MIILYLLAMAYDATFKKNWSGKYPQHEHNHGPRTEYKPMKASKIAKPYKDTGRPDKRA